MYRVNYLDNTKPEDLTLMMDIKDIQLIWEARAYNNHVNFITYLDTENTKNKEKSISKLMAYNVETNEIEEVLDREIYRYDMTDDEIYYTNKNQLMRYNKKTKEEQVLYQMDYTSHLYSDDNYFYLDDAYANPESFNTTEEEMERTLTVLDKSGKVIHCVKGIDRNYCLKAVDDNYLFFSYCGDIKLIKKDSIGTPDVKLIPFSHL